MRQSRFWFTYLTVVQAECASYLAENKCCKRRAAINTDHTIRIVCDLPPRPDKNPGAARDEQNWYERDDKFEHQSERAIRYKTECSNRPLCAQRNHYKPDDGDHHSDQLCHNRAHVGSDCSVCISSPHRETCQKNATAIFVASDFSIVKEYICPLCRLCVSRFPDSVICNWI